MRKQKKIISTKNICNNMIKTGASKTDLMPDNFKNIEVKQTQADEFIKH